MKTLLGVLLLVVAVVGILGCSSIFVYKEHQAEALKLSTPLFVERFGDRGDSIVLLHGLIASGRYWKSLIRDLDQEYQVIVPDLLGFGHSPWPNDIEYTTEDHLAAIQKTVDTVASDGKFVVIGQSMGALLALGYATKYPDRVKKVIVISPPDLNSREEAELRIRRQSSLEAMMSVGPTLSPILCHLHEALGSSVVPLFRPFVRDLPEYVVQDMHLHTWRSFNGSFENVVLKQSLEERLMQVPDGIPIMIMHGTQDTYTEPQRLNYLSNKYRVLFKLYEGDHNFILKNNPVALADLKEFIRK